MTAAIFPAYFLARLVVSRPYAIFAAVGAAAAPALSYSPFLVDEPLAYPAATLAFLLIARAAAAGQRAGRSAWRSRRAASASSSGRSSRSCSRSSRLVLLARLWRTERASAVAGDVVGGRLGRLRGAPRPASRSSSRPRSDAGRPAGTWRHGFLKERMLEYGLWAVGALAIGIGVVPLIAGARRTRPPARRAARRADDDLRHAHGLRARGLRPLHGGQGRLPLDDLRDRRRRAEPDLPHAASLHRTGARPRAAAALAFRRRWLATAFAAYVVSTTPYRSTTTRTTRRTAWRSRPSRTGSRAGRPTRSRRCSSIVALCVGPRARRARSPALTTCRAGRRRLDRRLRARVEPDDGDLRCERRESAPPTRRTPSSRSPRTGSTRRPGGSRRCSSARASATRTPSGSSSSGIRRSSGSGAWTAAPRAA